MIRARARLVGIRRVRFGVAAPAGRLACLCWLCCVAVVCCPAAVIGLLLPCAPLAFSCCLRPVMGRLAGLLSGCCFSVLCRCWLGLSCCALLGGYRGRIYQATRRLYRARKTPPGVAVRLPGGLFSSPPFAGVAGQSRPAPVGRRFSRLPVYLLGGPRCFRIAGLGLPVFRSSGAAPPHGTPHGKRHENFQRFPRRSIFRARSKSFFLVYLRPPIVPPRLAEINWKSRTPPRRKCS